MGLQEIFLVGLCFNISCDYDYGYNYDDYDIGTMEAVRRLSDPYEDIIPLLGDELARDNLRITTFKNGQLNGYTVQNGIVLGTGIAFEIFHILQAKYKFNYTIILPEADVFFDDSNKTGSKDLLENNEADFVVAFLPILNAFREIITYSTVLDRMEWVVLMNRPQSETSKLAILSPFSLLEWNLVIISIPFAGVVMYLIAWIQSRMFVEDEEKRNRYTLGKYLWFLYGAIVKEGYTVDPKNATSRLLVSSWWLYTITITSIYSANLIVFLTLLTTILPLQTMEDIGSNHQKWVTNTANGLRVLLYTESNQTTTYGQTISKAIGDGYYSNADDIDIIDYYVRQQNMVFIRERAQLNRVMYRYYLDQLKTTTMSESEICLYVVSKFNVIVKNRAFAYRNDFKYQPLFDHELRRIFEAGLVKHKLDANLPKTEICPLNLQTKNRQLKNEHLTFTYVVCGCCIGISIVVLLLECLSKLCSRRHKRKKNEIKLHKNKINLETVRDKTEKRHSTAMYHLLFDTPQVYGYSSGIKKHINGRDYWIVETDEGSKQLIPVRSPSALLFYIYEKKRL